MNYYIDDTDFERASQNNYFYCYIIVFNTMFYAFSLNF